MLDFQAINKAALASFPALLSRWLPNGKLAGHEYISLNPRRSDKKAGSFSINTATGVWSDFACGDKGSDPVSLYAYLNGITQSEAAKRLGEELGVHSEDKGRKSGHDKMNIVATYDYTDEAGDLLFQVLRLEPKSFRQRRPDPASKGGWCWSVRGITPVPLRLPALIRAVADRRRIWITEGEKDALALEAKGQVATCNPGGAGK